MTFTYNLNKSSLEQFLGNAVNGTTQTLIEQALTFNGLQPTATTLKTTIVDAQAPHVFNSSTTGYTNFTTSGQLFVVDIPLTAPDTTVSVTDTAGGNIFALGTFADTLNISNAGSLFFDTVYGGGNFAENITLGAGNFLAVAGAGVRSTITGGSGFDAIYGGIGGRTFIQAGSGGGLFGGDTSASAAFSYDTLVAGTGAGQILGVVDGHNVIWGAAIPATIGSGVQNTLWGGKGTDTIWGGGNSEIHAGSGTEDLWGGRWTNSVDTLVAGSGTDLLSAWAGNNLIYGYNTDLKGNTYSTGANTIWAGGGSDTVFGGGNSVINTVNDTLHPGLGHTEIWAGSFASSADTIVGGLGDTWVGLAHGNNSIQGGAGTLTAWTGTGKDTITLGSGSDTIGAQVGKSSIVGGTGHDTVFYWTTANSTIVGGADTTIDVVTGGSDITNAVTKLSATGATITFNNGNTLTYTNAKINIVAQDTISAFNKF